MEAQTWTRLPRKSMRESATAQESPVRPVANKVADCARRADRAPTYYAHQSSFDLEFDL